MNGIETWVHSTTENELLRELLLWLTTHGLYIASVVLGAYLIRRFSGLVIRKLVHSGIQRDRFATPKDEKQREDTITGLLEAIARIAIWIVATVVILSSLGVNFSALIAGAGAFGIAIGLGAQSLIRDFAAGLFIIMENQYRVGDIVEVNGKSGVVESITIRTTVLRDLDGYQHHVPNGAITNATNMSKDYSNINFDMGVSYDANIDSVEKTINKVGVAMQKSKKWGEYIIQPPKFLRVESFGDSAVTIKILARVQPGSQWKVAGELRRRIKAEFKKAKIEIPYPHIVVKK